jgi:cysteine-rich repeat protein
MCPTEHCANGVDDDHDGLTDCQDPDCASECSVETDCADQLDDDGDGFVDCADPDCAGNAACGAHEQDCTNALDDDGDGKIDCQDEDCPACPSNETSCDDGFDNDQDGFADCADLDCTAACGGTCGDGTVLGIEQCDDGNTVDGDGCSATCVLEDDTFCATLPPLAIGANVGSTVNGTNAFSAACIPDGGPERGFAFTAPQSGTLYLTLDAATNLGIHVELGCGSFATELACADDAPAGQLEAIVLPLPSGAPVSVFVDGNAPATAGDFTLLANFLSQ